MSILNKFFRSYIISSALLTHKNLIPTRRMSASTLSTEFSIAYVTAPNTEVAKTIAQKLVETHLSACVNIIPGITSIYEWKGKIETDSEVLMMIKTRTSIIEQLITVVKDNHPYEVCEVITVPIQHGNKPYLDWLSKAVPQP